MNPIEQQFRAQLGSNYDHTQKPTAYFFDYALEVESEGRPRFKNVVYISKRSKTAHDNQDFHRRADDRDKVEFPDEWGHYLKVKDNLKKPRIGLLPGIDEATQHEMRAIDIYNLEQLVAQDEFPEWIETARRILDVTDIREGRQTLQGNEGKLSERVLGTVGGGTYSEESSQEKNGKEKGFEEKSIPQENITFSYSMEM